jgi:hypothetical protein
MDLLAELGASLANLNVWGDISGNSGKQEQLVRESVAMHIGILALQETKTIGLEHRVTQDNYHREWHMPTGGPSTPPNLVDQDSWYPHSSESLNLFQSATTTVR